MELLELLRGRVRREVFAQPLLVSSGASWPLQLKQFMNGVDEFAVDDEFQYEFQESAVIS